ncbi:cyclodeaminase/cyclohydrolase family protein [Actinophytocola gossypii]|uniref:Cyclodeaminase/cyclohydrolase family protein n=1 Tax=Actinophytocola gossypii TaxID=2812003 RepID=A0ABT2J8K4_9PSEU|nr:cyclodeaminase/cyclohydrolase family protein [Actinophytocola gossypii]MCT2584204.1 cyclodeaminase/cyclohydrolase family protein [Actinophytocola gossypii]
MSFLQLSVGGLLERVAARTPAPGGGAVAALTGASAAALVAMAARFSGEPADRAEALRAELEPLADADAAAYTAVLAARRLPRDDPNRAARIADAMTEATEVPRRVAAAATEVAELAAALVERGNPNLVGDARVGELLARAAADAATALVRINEAG